MSLPFAHVVLSLDNSWAQQTKAINSLLHKQTTTGATVEILEPETGSETVIKTRKWLQTKARRFLFVCRTFSQRENEILRNFIKRFLGDDQNTENTFLSLTRLPHPRLSGQKA